MEETTVLVKTETGYFGLNPDGLVGFCVTVKETAMDWCWWAPPEFLQYILEAHGIIGL